MSPANHKLSFKRKEDGEKRKSSKRTFNQVGKLFSLHEFLKVFLQSTSSTDTQLWSISFWAISVLNNFWEN